MVYVKNIDNDLVKDHARAKREIISNGNTTRAVSNTTEPALIQPAKELNTTNEQGEYIQYIVELHDPSKLSVDLTNLRHYTTYSITVRACRELTEDDVAPPTNKLPAVDKPDPCSHPAQATITTAKKDDADDIKYFDAMNVVPSNESYGIVKVGWKAPENPNGLLLSYTIKYRKNEVENAHWESVCIPHQNYLNQTFYLLKPLSNGKSVRHASKLLF